MIVEQYAFWRRIDAPGHDACRLIRHDRGWTLQGTAIYRHAAGPACLHYRTSCNSAWETTEGEVHGWLGDREIQYRITREGTVWKLNGAAIPGLEPFVDLDLGFTPATNLLPLRRAPIPLNQSADMSAAWLDVDSGTLKALPQSYKRLSETIYEYKAPTFEYEALLEMAPNGFVRQYPGLWEAEPEMHSGG
ncbi:putative glycolipid-binding domain-containing protein [Paenibacillus hamazuiensis]|uniref:putative glycolipid-binding domain-containing protein n=1 Tax=Paenibacillus hamazuiensis TaxID=2936508 RepID=UPI00200BB7D1|nr:putative glycolipid-binding domain-containing protein [Paenibacillus hamazuiensis]